MLQVFCNTTSNLNMNCSRKCEGTAAYFDACSKNFRLLQVSVK